MAEQCRRLDNEVNTSGNIKTSRSNESHLTPGEVKVVFVPFCTPVNALLFVILLGGQDWKGVLPFWSRTPALYFRVSRVYSLPPTSQTTTIITTTTNEIRAFKKTRPHLCHALDVVQVVDVVPPRFFTTLTSGCCRSLHELVLRDNWQTIFSS